MLTISFDVIFLILALFLLHLLKKRNAQLGLRILLSLGFGILYGLSLKLISTSLFLELIKDFLYLMGHAYLILLKMLVIPLILTSITQTILNVGSSNFSDLKKVSSLTCLILLSFTAIASLVTIMVGKLYGVGEGLMLPELIAAPKHQYISLVDTLLGMLPSNPIASMTQENTIAIVIFAVLFALAARLVENEQPNKITVFKKFIEDLFIIVKKLTAIIIGLTPYGIFALISLLFLNQGMSTLLSMLNFIAAMYTAMILMFIIHSITLIAFGQNPWDYFKKASAPLLIAFTTRSSFGTLPSMEETLNKKFKTNQMIASFVPSIGATMGMNACAGIFPAMLVVMTMTILQQPMSFEFILMVVFINTLASLGMSGIPGTGFIAATITLTSLHLPLAVLALIQGIDPIIDMGRTATNINGVMTTAVVLDRITGKTQEDTSYADDGFRTILNDETKL